MTEADCWRIVELARAAAGGHVERQAEAIARHLATRPVDEIVAFSRWTRTKMLQANDAALLTAVEWVFDANGLPEVSGDSWEYFRGWLVGRGRDQYQAAIRDPDALADYFTTFDDFLSGEEIEYAAQRGFELSTGSRDYPDEMYEPSVLETWPGAEPDAERTPERLSVRFPKLRERFGPPKFA